MFLNNHADHVFRNRHFYLRNEKQAAVLKVKSVFLFELHRYLNENGFVFIDAPVLTKLLLYGDSTAFRVDYRNNGNRDHDDFLSPVNGPNAKSLKSTSSLLLRGSPSLPVLFAMALQVCR